MFDLYVQTVQGMMVVDREHRVVWISEGYKRFLPALGFAGEHEFVGQRIESMMPNTLLDRPAAAAARPARATLSGRAGLSEPTTAPTTTSTTAITVAPATAPITNSSADPNARASAALRLLPEQVAELERRAMAAALQATGGNRMAAARLLKISRAAFHDKLARYPELTARVLSEPLQP